MSAFDPEFDSKKSEILACYPKMRKVSVIEFNVHFQYLADIIEDRENIEGKFDGSVKYNDIVNSMRRNLVRSHSKFLVTTNHLLLCLDVEQAWLRHASRRVSSSFHICVDRLKSRLIRWAGDLDIIWPDHRTYDYDAASTVMKMQLAALIESAAKTHSQRKAKSITNGLIGSLQRPEVQTKTQFTNSINKIRRLLKEGYNTTLIAAILKFPSAKSFEIWCSKRQEFEFMNPYFKNDHQRYQQKDWAFVDPLVKELAKLKAARRIDMTLVHPQYREAIYNAVHISGEKCGKQGFCSMLIRIGISLASVYKQQRIVFFRDLAMLDRNTYTLPRGENAIATPLDWDKIRKCYGMVPAVAKTLFAEGTNERRFIDGLRCSGTLASRPIHANKMSRLATRLGFEPPPRGRPRKAT